MHAIARRLLSTDRPPLVLSLVALVPTLTREKGDAWRRLLPLVPHALVAAWRLLPAPAARVPIEPSPVVS